MRTGRLGLLAGELHRRNPVLTVAGWGFLALGLLLVAAMPVDDVEILGIDRFAKPAKFCFSIHVYLWSLAWFSGYLEGGRRLLRMLSAGIVLAMVVEIVCIAGQALRGQRSHFNSGTPFDVAVFSIMGSMIALNTVLAAAFLGLYLWRGRPLLPAYRLGIILGLVVFVGGSLEAVAMLLRGAHTVGGPDGGPGLPLMNWSTNAGDLRAAHLLGLHALQVLPIVGWLCATYARRWQTALILTITAAYVALGVALFTQAMAGKPLVGV